jgi:hypothetical protein
MRLRVHVESRRVGDGDVDGDEDDDGAAFLLRCDLVK